MATAGEPDIVLYDLACTKKVCFSPVVWRIRFMLNYKRIPYRTIFLEFPDIETTLKGLGIVPGESAGNRYTVPAIHHIPTDTYMMDSTPIAKFIESNYPSPPIPLTSELGRDIEGQVRGVIGKAFSQSVMPREVRILSPRSAEYFRKQREAVLGHPLEDLLDPETEEQAWRAVDSDTHALGQMLLKNQADGPFILGAQPSYTDFLIAGSLQTARVVDEGIFQRVVKYPGFGEIYGACSTLMEKQD